MSLALKASKARAAQSGATLGGVSQRGFRGDPGLFGDIFGGIAKIGSFIPGPIGTAIGGIGTIFGGKQAPPPLPQAPSAGPGGTQFAPQQVPFHPPMVPTPGFGGAVERFLPGGSTGFQPGGNGSMAGHHLNKSDYWLKDGTFVQKGTRWVKNRKRNPLNAKAASRAIQRLESAKKATARINRISIRKAPCKR